MNRLLIVLLFFSLFFGTGARSLNSQDHVVLNTFEVNIRTGPGTDFYVVCMAGKGEIFKLIDQKGDWVEIKMFSDDSRYIHLDHVYFLTEFVEGHNMTLPKKDKISILQKSAIWAESVSEKEAEEIIPVALDKKKHKVFRNIRYDKNMHDVYENQGIQTVMFDKIRHHKEKNSYH